MVSLVKIKNFIFSEKFIIIFLLIFSAILRFTYLNEGLFHHDSVQLAVAVEKTVDEPGLYGIGGGRHGLVLINSAFFYLFKTFLNHLSAEFTVNFTSALFGTISIAILYLFLKELTNNKFLSFSSSILYSVTPIFLSVSTFAKEHTLDVFLVLLSLLLLIKGLIKNNNRLILSAGIVLSLLIFVRFPSILIIFSAIFIIYYYKVNKFRRIAIYLGPFVIIIFLYLLFAFDTFTNEARSNFNILSLENIKFILLNNFKYSIEGIIFSLTIFGIILTVLGFIFLFKENKKLFYFLILFFIPLFVFYASSKTVSHRFFSLPLIPLIVSFSYAIEYVKRKNIYAGSILLILILSAFFINIYPVIKFRSEYSAFKELATIINDNTAPGDSIVILVGDDTAAINYYSKTPTRTCEYEKDLKSMEKFITQIFKFMIDDIKVYISGSCFGLGNTEGKILFLNQMDTSFKGTIVAEYLSDDFHRGSIKPTINKIPMIRLYPPNSQFGKDIRNLILK